MKHDEFFRRNLVFSSSDLASHLSVDNELGRRAQESLLAYYQKSERLVRIRRGLYTIVPRGADINSFAIDPFLVAAKLTDDAILSHHTALEFHGKAYSVREAFTYSAARPLNPFQFRSNIFRGTKLPQVLANAGQESFGVLSAERSGVEIRVTSLERTFVDVLSHPSFSGGWEEIWRSLESIEYFDLDSVLEYAILLGNSTTIAKVGFFLDQHRSTLMVEESHLKREELPRIAP